MSLTYQLYQNKDFLIMTEFDIDTSYKLDYIISKINEIPNDDKEKYNELVSNGFKYSFNKINGYEYKDIKFDDDE